MNQLLNLLLLSTAASQGMKRSRYEHMYAASHTGTKNAPLSRKVVSTPSKKTAYNRSTPEEVPTSTLLSALNAADQASGLSPYATGPFELMPLDYDYDALEPYIDEPTLRVHHLGHEQTYINNLNAALARYPQSYNLTLNEMLLFPDRLPGDIYTQITNNAGGVYNHQLMWKMIGPNRPAQPSGALGAAINNEFGSLENFNEAFAAAAESVFGSGYAYLVLNPYGRLLIVTTSNQTTPIPLRSIPLLPLDVWEHAYYLKHQNKRRDYIRDYLSVIDWDQVGRRYEAAYDALGLPEMQNQ